MSVSDASAKQDSRVGTAEGHHKLAELQNLHRITPHHYSPSIILSALLTSNVSVRGHSPDQLLPFFFVVMNRYWYWYCIMNSKTRPVSLKRPLTSCLSKRGCGKSTHEKQYWCLANTIDSVAKNMLVGVNGVLC